jgi:hypothetical protein
MSYNLSNDSIPISIGSFSSYSYSTDSIGKTETRRDSASNTNTMLPLKNNEILVNKNISLYINLDKARIAIFVILCIIILCLLTSIVLIILCTVSSDPNKYYDYIWNTLLVSLILSFCGCSCLSYVCEIDNDTNNNDTNNNDTNNNDTNIYTKFLSRLDETSV